MNIKIRLFYALALAGLVPIISSCASSERMMRMSGVIDSYAPPRKERISNSSIAGKTHYQIQGTVNSLERKKASGQVTAYDDALINIWPALYRNAQYLSILWPMVDSDQYGFAIRPFYNQEGNEYSILFPMAAWNPVNGDGWGAMAYWQTGKYAGFFPFYHASFKQDGNWNGYSALYWQNDKKYGVFPLVWGKEGIDKDGYFICGPAYASGGSYGFAPVTHFGKDAEISFAGPLWKSKDWDSYGFFPLARIKPGIRNVSYIGPFFIVGSWEKYGFFPLFANSKDGGYAFPLYYYDDKTFLSILGGARYGKNDKIDMLSVLGPMYVWKKNERIPFLSTSNIKDEKGNQHYCYHGDKTFRLVGLLGYFGSNDYMFPKEKSREFDELALAITRAEYAEKGKENKKREEVVAAAKKFGIEISKPKNDEDIAKLKNELLKYTQHESENYFGIAPLFHAESLVDTYRYILFLGLLAESSRTNDGDISRHILGPFVFRYGNTTYPYRKLTQDRISITENENNLNILLLAFFQEKQMRGWESFEQRNKIIKLFKSIRDYRTFANKIPGEETKISTAMKELGCESAVPRTDEEENAILDIMREKYSKQYTESRSMVLPLFYSDRTLSKNTLVIPALMAGISSDDDGTAAMAFPFFYTRNGKDSSTNIIFPLMSGFDRTENTSTSVVLPFYIAESYKRTVFYPCSDVSLDTAFNLQSSVKTNSEEYFLLGLLGRNDKNILCVWTDEAKKKAIPEAYSNLTAFAETIRRKESSENDLKRLQAELEKRYSRNISTLAEAEKVAAGFKGKDYQLQRFIELSAELNGSPEQMKKYRSSGVKNLNAEYASLRQEAEDSLRKAGINEPLPDTAEAVKRLPEKIRDDFSTELTARKRRSLVYSQTTVGNDIRWDVLWILARQNKQGDKNDVRVLEYIYRHQKDGDLESTVIFPGIAIQKDTGKSKYSFLWRVFSVKNENGSTSGHIFFIPWG